tara:strand:- start:31539 stop:31871 length:333 start_codon:yes stop_codon:yes gene_type:complete
MMKHLQFSRRRIEPNRIARKDWITASRKALHQIPMKTVVLDAGADAEGGHRVAATADLTTTAVTAITIRLAVAVTTRTSAVGGDDAAGAVETADAMVETVARGDAIVFVP